MGIATRDDILNVFDNATADIDALRWGTVRIRTMSAAERLELTHTFQQDTLTNEAAAEFYCHLIALCVVDEKGARLFDDNGDVHALQSRDWEVIEHVATEILRFNGLAPDDAEQLEKK